MDFALQTLWHSLLICCLKLLVDGMPVDEALREWEDSDRLDSTGSDSAVLSTERLQDCIEFRSESGIFSVSSMGTTSTCGLYLVGPMDSQVAIDFLEFDVECDNKNLIGVLDGWEQNGYVFPPKQDLIGRNHLRYETYCGAKRPKDTFLSTGNMALIQHHLTTPGSGFVVRAQFLKNPQPCNMISLFPGGLFTMRNYGMRLNCSMLAIYPQKITFSLADVGVNRRISESSLQLAPAERAPYNQICDPYQGDYVEIKGGNSISVIGMTSFKQICGFTDTADESFGVSCGSTAIRLVSSGMYENVVIVETEPLDADLSTGVSNQCRLT